MIKASLSTWRIFGDYNSFFSLKILGLENFIVQPKLYFYVILTKSSIESSHLCTTALSHLRTAALSQGPKPSTFSVVEHAISQNCLESTLGYGIGYFWILEYQVSETLTKNYPGLELQKIRSCSQLAGS